MELPGYSPMLATLADLDAAREPGAWHFEVKWDGYRAVAGVTDGVATFRSRRGLDLTASYPELGELGRYLAGHDVVLDGEVVALRPDGRSSFELLQQSVRAGRAHLMVFDLLFLDGVETLSVPYLQRRELLVELLGAGTDHVHVPETFGAERDLALATSRELKLEGLIAKRVDSTYQPGARTSAWLKLKNVYDQDVVVVGWTPGSGRRGGSIGSLLLAVNGPDGLVYVGHAGSGFTEAGLADAERRLAPLATDHAPLDGVPRADARTARWVRPELVGSVSYGEWTNVGRLRHPVWRGFRDDVAPADVRRDPAP